MTVDPRSKCRITIEVRASLAEEAVRLGVDVQAACQRGLKTAVENAWLEENREAIIASNAYVDAHGLPLARERDLAWSQMDEK